MPMSMYNQAFERTSIFRSGVWWHPKLQSANAVQSKYIFSNDPQLEDQLGQKSPQFQMKNLVSTLEFTLDSPSFLEEEFPDETKET